MVIFVHVRSSGQREVRPVRDCADLRGSERFACRSAYCQLVLPLLLFALALMSGNTQAQAVLAPPQVQPQVLNALKVAASKAGIRQCLPQLVAVSEMGVQGTVKNDVLLDWDRQHPAGSPVFSLVGLESTSGNAVMSVAAAPDGTDSCSIVAERISVESSSCPQVAQQQLQGYQSTRLLDAMTVYTQVREPGSTVSLIGLSRGCLVVRRYVHLSVAP